MPEKGEFDSVPGTGELTSVPEGITGRGRERFFNLLKEGLVISLLSGAGMFGVLTGIGGAREGVLELSVAISVTGGAVWIIGPFTNRMAHGFAECIRRR